MIKNKININNPLTVIAIFSMLTEASAAASLPYIDSENQKIYVWFLIVFPSFLITLFFLTLNFNNKTLYTPAEFSKERTPLPPPVPAASCTTQASALSSANTGLPPSNLLSQSGIKFSSCPPQRYIFLPRPPKHSENNLKIPARPDLSQTPDTRAEGAGFNFHLIDLSHTAWRLTHKNTLSDVLRSYFKSTHQPKNCSHKNDVFLLLTDTQSEGESSFQYSMMSKHKSATLFGQATVLTYNTETHQLSRLRSP